MTVKELNRLYYLRNLLTREQEKLSTLNARLANTGMNFSGLPRAESTDVHRLEEAVADVIAEKKRIQNKQAEYAKEKQKIEDYINSIDDLRIRCILSLRFVDLLSWRQIARKLGGGNTEDGVRKAAKRFLQRK